MAAWIEFSIEPAPPWWHVGSPKTNGGLEKVIVWKRSGHLRNPNYDYWTVETLGM